MCIRDSRYTVLRDGASVAEGLVSETTTADLVEKMIGRSLDAMYPSPGHGVGEPALVVRNLSGRTLPQEVNLDLHRGEILGLFGVVGAGRTELARCLVGLGRVRSGTFVLHGNTRVDLSGFQPLHALKSGLDYLSENRKDEGLAQSLSIAENTTLSAIRKTSRFGILALRREAETADHWATELGVRCANTRQPVSALSGGNQQKVALARMIHHDSDLFIMDEPTRGIDVGSKHEIYELIHALAEQGKSVIVISSYLPELLGICHSVAVMHRGHLSEKRPTAEWPEQEIMLFATTGQYAEPATPDS